MCSEFFLFISFFFFFVFVFFLLMIRRPPRSTLDRSSAASDVYKRQALHAAAGGPVRVRAEGDPRGAGLDPVVQLGSGAVVLDLSLIHISEPTRPY